MFTMKSLQRTHYATARQSFCAICSLSIALGIALCGKSSYADIPQVSTVTPAPALLELQNGFERVAQAVHPAVVSIMSRMTVSLNARRPSAGSQVARGTGSGFIVRSDGYIVTNDHVVAGADRVTVQLDDGRVFPGVVHRDPRSDLAVIKINATNLPTLSWQETATRPHVGQWALAFGSPFALNDTMTVGIVSALGRESVVGGEQGEPLHYYPNLLQTDAAINPGNSGGPLLDIFGRVMGVNVAISSPNGGNVGIGFAIPAQTARSVVDQLITKGTVTRGFLGFTPANLSAADRERYGTPAGVLVVGIEVGFPAARSGLRVEDVVTHLDDKAVTDAAELRESISKVTPGVEVALRIVRNGQSQTLRAKVEKIPTETGSITERPYSDSVGKLGVGVADLTPEIAQKLGLTGDRKYGVVIVEVAAGSPAAEADLQPGDVFLTLDSKPVHQVKEISALIESALAAKRSEFSLVIERGSSQLLRRIALE